MSDIIKQGNRTSKTTLECITELEAERDQLKADLGDACEENGRIVDSSLKDIGALKVELGQLREQWREQKWKVGKLYDQLTTAKEALRNINELCVKVQMQSTQRLYQEAPFVVRKVKDIVTESLTELEGEKKQITEDGLVKDIVDDINKESEPTYYHSDPSTKGVEKRTQEED